jgi:hypothetical protein
MRSTFPRVLALATAVLLWGPGCSIAADPLAPLVDPYLRVQSQLASDRVAGIANDAAALEKAAANRGGGAQAIAAAARALGQAQTLAAAREAFGRLSTALIEYADSGGMSLGPDVNVFHCSMAKQSWLQKGTAPKNPYYGASMLACGELKKR